MENFDLNKFYIWHSLKTMNFIPLNEVINIKKEVYKTIYWIFDDKTYEIFLLKNDISAVIKMTNVKIIELWRIHPTQKSEFTLLKYWENWFKNVDSFFPRKQDYILSCLYVLN